MNWIKSWILIGMLLFSAPAWADKIAAIIDDEVITQSDVDRALLFARLQGKEVPDKKEMLEHMIENKLLYSEAKRREIEPDTKKIKTAIEHIRQNFDSEEAFKSSLEKEGLSVKLLYDRFREQSMIKNLVDSEVSSKIYVSPVEIAQYYEKHETDFCDVNKIKVDSVLISYEQVGENAEELAKDLAVNLRKGTAIWKQAQQKYSEGLFHGWISKDEVAPALHKLFYVDVDVYPDPIKVKSGYYLFRVRDIDQKCPSSLEEIKDRVYAVLYKEKFDKEFNDYIEKLKERSFIKTFDLD